MIENESLTMNQINVILCAQQKTKSPAGANGGYYWIDGQDTSLPVPIYGGHVFAKLLRLDDLPHAGLRPMARQRRPGVSKANAQIKTPEYKRVNAVSQSYSVA
jgi:hypothetical protein